MSALPPRGQRRHDCPHTAYDAPSWGTPQAWRPRPLLLTTYHLAPSALCRRGRRTGPPQPLPLTLTLTCVLPSFAQARSQHVSGISRNLVASRRDLGASCRVSPSSADKVRSYPKPRHSALCCNVLAPAACYSRATYQPAAPCRPQPTSLNMPEHAPACPSPAPALPQPCPSMPQHMTQPLPRTRLGDEAAHQTLIYPDFN